MIDCKPLKNFSNHKTPSKLYFWWLDTTISKYYYKFIRNFITNPIFQVKRLTQWYINVFQYDFDFDGHSLFAIIEYKLKRLEKVLSNGHAIQDPKDMKALKLAIKLAGRLKEDNYEHIPYARIKKKYGSLQNCGREELMRIYTSAESKMKREEKQLYSILLNHLRNLWD